MPFCSHIISQTSTSACAHSYIINQLGARDSDITPRTFLVYAVRSVSSLICRCFLSGDSNRRAALQAGSWHSVCQPSAVDLHAVPESNLHVCLRFGASAHLSASQYKGNHSILAGKCGEHFLRRQELLAVASPVPLGLLVCPSPIGSRLAPLRSA